MTTRNSACFSRKLYQMRSILFSNSNFFVLIRPFQLAWFYVRLKDNVQHNPILWISRYSWMYYHLQRHPLTILIVDRSIWKNLLVSSGNECVFCDFWLHPCSLLVIQLSRAIIFSVVEQCRYYGSRSGNPSHQFMRNVCSSSVKRLFSRKLRLKTSDGGYWIELTLNLTMCHACRKVEGGTK